MMKAVNLFMQKLGKFIFDKGNNNDYKEIQNILLIKYCLFLQNKYFFVKLYQISGSFQNKLYTSDSWLMTICVNILG